MVRVMAPRFSTVVRRPLQTTFRSLRTLLTVGTSILVRPTRVVSMEWVRLILGVVLVPGVKQLLRSVVVAEGSMPVVRVKSSRPLLPATQRVKLTVVLGILAVVGIIRPTIVMPPPFAELATRGVSFAIVVTLGVPALTAEKNLVFAESSVILLVRNSLTVC